MAKKPDPKKGTPHKKNTVRSDDQKINRAPKGSKSNPTGGLAGLIGLGKKPKPPKKS